MKQRSSLSYFGCAPILQQILMNEWMNQHSKFFLYKKNWISHYTTICLATNYHISKIKNIMNGRYGLSEQWTEGVTINYIIWGNVCVLYMNTHAQWFWITTTLLNNRNLILYFY